MNIYDVAKKAGVSIATVSRVLNGTDNVSAKTRDKVLAVMDESGYTPNVFARGLGLGSMKMIGVLCTDVADLYYAKAVSVMQKLLREDEYDVLLYCTGDTRKEKQLCLQRLLDKKVDAIITVGSAFKNNLPDADFKAAAACVPVILINAESAVPGTYSVICDEAAATRENVQLLHKAGCRSLLYLFDSDSASGKAKYFGFQAGATALGIAEKCAAVKSACTPEAAAAAFAAACAENPAIDAVLTSEDILAVGVLQQLAREGRSLPVIGFNNSLLAQCTTPALTSVDNMVEALSSTAVSLLKDLLCGGTAATRIVLSPHLVQRESFTI